ncbi:hypothetical protein D3C76_1487250 [compost metagenome]
MAHCDAIVHADRIEFKRNAARFPNCFFDDFTELLQMNMPRYDIDIRVADRDKRFIEILFFNAGCPQQAAMRRTVEAFFDHIGTHFLGCHDTYPPMIYFNLELYTAKGFFTVYHK